MKSLLTHAGLFLVSAALLLGAPGCSRKPKNLTPLPTGRSSAPPPTTGVPVDPGSGTGRLGSGSGAVNPTDFGNGKGATDPTFTGDPSLHDVDLNQNQDRSIFASDTIYFDFDKSSVKSQYSSNISKVADYLKGHPGDSVLIEGNCDDRGTPEYNRALGERRALSVREKLLALGVNTEQCATISFGEEKPADLGVTESAYAKNRRAEFVLLLGPSSSR